MSSIERVLVVGLLSLLTATATACADAPGDDAAVAEGAWQGQGPLEKRKLSDGDAALLANIVDVESRGPDGEPFHLLLVKDGTEMRVLLHYGRSFEIWRGKGITSLAQVTTSYELLAGSEISCAPPRQVSVGIGGESFAVVLGFGESDECTLRAEKVVGDTRTMLDVTADVLYPIEFFERTPEGSLEHGRSKLRVCTTALGADLDAYIVKPGNPASAWLVPLGSDTMTLDTVSVAADGESLELAVGYGPERRLYAVKLIAGDLDVRRTR